MFRCIFDYFFTQQTWSLSLNYNSLTLRRSPVQLPMKTNVMRKDVIRKVVLNVLSEDLLTESYSYEDKGRFIALGRVNFK